MTGHNSEGATLRDNVVICVKDAFCSSMLYVTLLSRVRSHAKLFIVGGLTPDMFSPIRLPYFNFDRQTIRPPLYPEIVTMAALAPLIKLAKLAALAAETRAKIPSKGHDAKRGKIAIEPRRVIKSDEKQRKFMKVLDILEYEEESGA
ncbi:hypothetical protein KFL_015290010, partial [Klebsormidium nitens]